VIGLSQPQAADPPGGRVFHDAPIIQMYTCLNTHNYPETDVNVRLHFCSILA